MKMFHNPLPNTPTTAAPGTVEKVEVMRSRANKRQQLHHPADARFQGDHRPIEFINAKEEVRRAILKPKPEVTQAAIAASRFGYLWAKKQTV